MFVQGYIFPGSLVVISYQYVTMGWKLMTDSRDWLTDADVFWPDFDCGSISW